MPALMIDEENNAERWWAGFRALAATEIPAELRCFREVHGPVLISVGSRQLAELRDWCAELAGWADGPEYAKTALLLDPNCAWRPGGGICQAANGAGQGPCRYCGREI